MRNQNTINIIITVILVPIIRQGESSWALYCSTGLLWGTRTPSTSSGMNRSFKDILTSENILWFTTEYFCSITLGVTGVYHYTLNSGNTAHDCCVSHCPYKITQCPHSDGEGTPWPPRTCFLGGENHPTNCSSFLSLYLRQGNFRKYPVWLLFKMKIPLQTMEM